jgi:hypothetical protein
MEVFNSECIARLVEGSADRAALVRKNSGWNFHPMTAVAP